MAGNKAATEHQAEQHISNLQRQAISLELELWREAISKQQIYSKSNDKSNNRTVAILGAGAGLCTYSAVRAGFRPIYAAEVEEDRNQILRELYNLQCIGDAFKADYSSLERPMYLTTSMPCIDYSRSGPKLGQYGDTGWMFTEQVNIILSIKATAIRLEISDYIWQVNEGEEIKYVLNELRKLYIVKHTVLDVWQYGDPSSRRRTIIVGLLKELGPVAHTFEFPSPNYDETHWHCARDVAVPDEDVDEKYWRYDEPERVEWREPETGKQHKIAQSGEGMGFSQMPHSVQSWEGTFNGQTKLNGGGRRPKLSWQMSQYGAIGPTRLTTPIEAGRIASMPQWYIDHLRQINSEDTFIFECVNDGIPARTATAIDTAVMRVLDMLEVEMSQEQGTEIAYQAMTDMTRQLQSAQREAYRVQATVCRKRKRSAMLDTGANRTLMFRDVEGSLDKKRKSNMQIQIANSEYMVGEQDGVLNMIGTNNEEFMEPVTTAEGIPRELYSVDNKYFNEHYSVILSQPDFTVKCNKCGEHTAVGEPRIARNESDGETSIPVRPDSVNGGFWVDYDTSNANERDEYDYDSKQAYGYHLQACAHSAVTEVIYGDEAEPCNIRGVKSGLKSTKQKMTAQQFHEEHGHLGSCPGCWICSQTKGVSRKITRIVDRYKEFKPMHTFVLDTVTVDTTSLCGCIYMIVLKDKGSGIYHAIFLQSKAHSAREIETWIKSVRNDPMYQHLGYPAIQHLEMDSAGEWDVDCEEWYEMEQRMQITSIRSCPDRKESNATAERACQEIEHGMKAGLMQENLPPSWWVRCAKQAIWLRNRFGRVVTEARIAADGDQPRPLEIATKFAYSRRQIDRELSYFVPTGRLCLVHLTKVKGSSIAPKSRFAVSIEMYRDQVVFWSPYTKRTFRSKSYAAYKLRAGLNYMHMLGLPIQAGSLGKNTLPADLSENVTITLPAIRSGEDCEPLQLQPGPIRSAKIAADDNMTALPYGDAGLPEHESPHESGDAHEPPFDKPPAIPIVDVSQGGQGLGGSLVIKDQYGNPMDLDLDTGELLSAPVTPVLDESRLTYESIPGTIEKIEDASMQHGQHMNSADKHDQSLICLRDNQTDAHDQYTHLTDEHDQSMISPRDHQTDEYENLQQIKAAQNKTCEQHTNIAAKTKTAKQKISQAEMNQKATEPYNSKRYEVKVLIKQNRKLKQLWDQCEAIKLSQYTITSGVNDSMIQICKKHKLARQKHNAYRDWMLKTQKSPEGSKLIEDDLPPTDSRVKIRPGIRFPRPSGYEWRQLTETNHSDTSAEAENKRLVNEAVNKVKKELELQKEAVRRTGKVHFTQAYKSANIETVMALMVTTAMANKEIRVLTARKKKKVKKRRRKAVAGDREEAPKTTKACLESEQGAEWEKSIEEEMSGLEEMGVIEHGYTIEQCRELGITSKPIPVVLCHDYKYDEHGNVDRLKTRCCLQGHSGNMFKGVHFWDTFTATPKEDTSRIMQAIMVDKQLLRKAGDIKQAYCWAKLPKHKWLIGKYPRGLERYDEQGRELMMLIKSNLYGSPEGGRNWGKLRDYTIMSVFNDETVRQKLQFSMQRDEVNLSERAENIIKSGELTGWTCKQNEMDPCFFTFTAPTGTRVWAEIHTDDIDAIGEKQEDLDLIFSILDRIWKVKEVNSEYILGVNRKLIKASDGKIAAVELTMKAYVEGMAAAFKEQLPDGTVNTPFPEKVTLDKDEASDAEVQEVLDLEYQRAVGLILWAVRHTYPEGRFGVSQLCRVMARPSHKAFKAAMHMISWMAQRPSRGIKFTAGGNKQPIAQFDASNKPIPESGLAQGGFVIHWMNGPVSTYSKRMHHRGLSSEHNEYMALTAATKSIIWLRQFLQEAELGEYVSEPTLVYGDNVQANKLCREHFVTTGNQYIYLPYHFSREAYQIGMIDVKWVKSKHNLADAMTKPLSSQQLNGEQGMLKYLLGYAHLDEFRIRLEEMLDGDAIRAFRTK